MRRPTHQKPSPCAWFALGFLATICQVLLLREFLVFCTGSELGIALLLCAWLAGIAGGSAVSRLLLRTSPAPGAWLPLSLTLLALSCPVSLMLARLSVLLFQSPAGALAPLGHLAITALITAIPPGFLVGIAFPLACAVEVSKQGSPAQGGPTGSRMAAIGRIYALEAAGSVCAGLLHTWLLVAWLSPTRTAMLSSAGLILAAAWSFRFVGGTPKHGRLAATARWAALTVAVVMLVTGLFPVLGDGLEHLTLDLRWQARHPGLDLVASLETPYQRLEVGRLQNQTIFVANGAVRTAYPDPWSARLWGHLLLSAHPNPRRVLLVGGLETGLLATMLRHPELESILFVELDPALPVLYTRYAVDEDRIALTDPRFTLLTGDGRRLVSSLARRAASSGQERWDQIVILLPDPDTMMINRYYTREFYSDCRRLLRPGGELICRVSASANYLGGEAGDLARSIRTTLKDVFPSVQAAGGDRLVFAASRDPAGPGFFSADQLVAHYGASGCVDPGFSPLAFHTLVDQDRTAYREQQLQKHLPSAPARINSDRHPQALIHTLRLWSRYAGHGIDSFFRLLFRPVPPWTAVALLMLPLLWALAPLARRRPGRGRSQTGSILTAVSMAGFTGLALELICIFIYQNAFGNLYRMIGSLVALFMFGLALGGMNAVPLGRIFSVPGASGPRRLLIMALAGQSILALCSPAAMSLVAGGRWLHDTGIAAQGLVFLLTSAAGWLTGLALPAAGGALPGTDSPVPGRGTGSASARINSADHLGAMAASGLIGLAALPRFGIVVTSGLLALVTFCCALRLAVEQWQVKRSG